MKYFVLFLFITASLISFTTILSEVKFARIKESKTGVLDIKVQERKI